MDGTREGLSEIDRALAQALDVDVSADFAARVRRRIAVEPPKASSWRGWRIALPMAAAALIVIAAGLTMVSRRSLSTPRLLAARSVSLPQLLPAADVRPAALLLAVNASAPVTRPGAPSLTAFAPHEPEVLVPSEEIAMYRRLIAAAQDVPQAFVIEAPQDIVAGLSISDITIDPVKIEPIVPPAGGEGDRQ